MNMGLLAAVSEVPMGVPELFIILVIVAPMEKLGINWGLLISQIITILFWTWALFIAVLYTIDLVRRVRGKK